MKKTFSKLLGIVFATCLFFTSALPVSAYTVKRGDTLSKIARENATTITAIKNLITFLMWI